MISFRGFSGRGKQRRYLKRGGQCKGDYEMLSGIIDRYKPASLLDAGCGSGRLFGLYQEKSINNVVGVDISAKALRLANNKAFPSIKTVRARLEDMNFGYKRFDLAISNRTRQHTPRKHVDVVIEKICFSSYLVYT